MLEEVREKGIECRPILRLDPRENLSFAPPSRSSLPNSILLKRERGTNTADASKGCDVCRITSH